MLAFLSEHKKYILVLLLGLLFVGLSEMFKRKDLIEDEDKKEKAMKWSMSIGYVLIVLSLLGILFIVFSDFIHHAMWGKKKRIPQVENNVDYIRMTFFDSAANAFGFGKKRRRRRKLKTKRRGRK